MLDIIFGKGYNINEKKKFLQDEYGVAMTEALKLTPEEQEELLPLI